MKDLLTVREVVTTGNFEIEYFCFKGGDSFLLAFNGYGENAEDFHQLARIHESKYTLIAINLPYHGESRGINGQQHIWSSEDLKLLLRALKERFRFNRFSLLGYSLGAKIAFGIFEICPTQVNSLILFAPDGIINNRWYNLVVHYSLTKNIFKSIIDHPTYFFKLIRLMGTLGLISKKLSRFIFMHLETREKREMVLNVWECNKYLLPDIPKIKSLIKENNTDVQLFFGKNDRIIKPKIARKFMKGIEKNCKFKLLDCGHRMLTKENLGFIN